MSEEVHIKRYLVTAGDNYYPCSGTSDWKDSFDDKDEAIAYAEKLEKERLSYSDSSRYDWVNVIDLSNWQEIF